MTVGLATEPKGDSIRSGASFFRSCLLALMATGVVVSILVGWSWLVGGRGLADRALTDLAMPIGLLWLSTFAASFYGFFRRNWRVLIAGVMAWLFVTLSFGDPVANALMKSVEIPAEQSPVSQLDRPVDVVVLLGGYGNVDRFGTLELGTDGQRLFLTAQLFKSGKTKAIVCTGSAHFGDFHPSKVGRQLLESIDIPGDAIFEVPGVNTSAEMRNLESFFADPPEELTSLLGRPPERVALVTSAYHLTRAMRLAGNRQLDFIPIGCMFSGTAEPTFSPRSLIPTAGAGARVARAIKEWIAWSVGR